MSQAETPIMEVRDVARTFDVSDGIFVRKKKLQALRGINFSLRKGEVLALVGESGCGKSTLARNLLSLDSPTSGNVLLDGTPISRLHRSVLSRRVQPIFQDPYSSLNPRKTIGSIITLPLRVHGIGDARQNREALQAMMERVGLPPRLEHVYPGQLSGGQRQRVAIARALIIKPEIVICDEPTSALDVSVQSQILNLLMELREKFGLTYVFISHNLAVVEHIATRIAVMYLGRIVEQAETEEFFRSPRHPYSKALLSSVLTPDPRLDVPDSQLGTAFPNPLEPPGGCSFHQRCAECMPLCAHVAPEPGEGAESFVECHLYADHNSAGYLSQETLG